MKRVSLHTVTYFLQAIALLSIVCVFVPILYPLAWIIGGLVSAAAWTIILLLVPPKRDSVEPVEEYEVVNEEKPGVLKKHTKKPKKPVDRKPEGLLRRIQNNGITARAYRSFLLSLIVMVTSPLAFFGARLYHDAFYVDSLDREFDPIREAFNREGVDGIGPPEQELTLEPDTTEDEPE